MCIYVYISNDAWDTANVDITRWIIHDLMNAKPKEKNWHFHIDKVTKWQSSFGHLKKHAEKERMKIKRENKCHNEFYWN